MIQTITNEEILTALEGTRRQYLVGDLKLPQALRHQHSKDLEIGITRYEESFSEAPHTHDVTTEYQYVLSGWTRYLDLDTGTEYDFRTGDFYAITTGTKYAQKSKPGTAILFIKVPSLNDKKLLDVSAELQKWLDTPLQTVRTDYFHEENAPSPNSIKPAAAVAVVNDNRVLLVRRRDNSKWTLPGGTLEYGESLPQCAVRELAEETNLKVEITDILGTYTSPNVLIAYSDGEVRQEFTIVYISRTADTEVRIDSESTDYQWVSVEQLDELELADSQRLRLEDLQSYLAHGERQFK